MTKENTEIINTDKITITDMDDLCRNSIDLIRYARGLAVRQINIIEIMTNYALGRWIVEEQQNGQDRAKYGARVIDHLSEALTEEFGRGYARESLRNARMFYLTFNDRISQTLFTEFAINKSQTLFRKLKDMPFALPWSHYLILMRIKNPDERSFYEIEATKNQWNVRQLQRQYSSSLYERLLLSSDKDKVMELATKGTVIRKPEDIVKDPFVLEFLGFPSQAEYSESELETRVLNHLQEFIMELGTGFAYMGREVRIEVGDTEKFIDMLFYNTKRHCYVVLEVKTGKFDSSYAGQLGTYVVAVNHQIKSEEDNPTVGLLICKDLDKVEAQYALESSSQPIGVSSYELSKLIPEEFKGSMPTIEEIEAEFGNID